MLVGSRAGQGIAARRQNPSAMRLLQLLALAAQLSLSSPQGSPPCPCGDPSLCRPLHPQPARPWEFVAFHAAAQPTHSLQGAGNGSDWRLWDWSKITTVAPSAPTTTHPTPPTSDRLPPIDLLAGQVHQLSPAGLQQLGAGRWSEPLRRQLGVLLPRPQPRRAIPRLRRRLCAPASDCCQLLPSNNKLWRASDAGGVWFTAGKESKADRLGEFYGAARRCQGVTKVRSVQLLQDRDDSRLSTLCSLTAVFQHVYRGRRRPEHRHACR